MALLEDVEARHGGDSDDAPPTKGDEKKTRHLQVIGIVVGIIAAIIGYVYYRKNQAANAGAATTSATGLPGTGTVAGDTGGGGGGGAFDPSSIISAIQQADADTQSAIAGLSSQITGNTNTPGASTSTTNNYYNTGGTNGKKTPSSPPPGLSNGATSSTSSGTFESLTHKGQKVSLTLGGAVRSGKTVYYQLTSPADVRTAQAAGLHVATGKSLAGVSGINPKGTYLVR